MLTLRHLGHGRQPAGPLADDLFLVATLFVDVDHGTAKFHKLIAEDDPATLG